MTTKTNWANRTKETISAVPNTITIPAGMEARGGGGTGEKVIAYYRFTQPRTPNEYSRVLAAGDSVEGTYEGSFESQNFPGNFTYKVRTAEGLIGLPHCKQLGEDLGKLPTGTQVFVAYKGTETVKTGKYAGKPRHAFLVASEPVEAK